MSTCTICGEGNVTEVVDESDYWDEHFARWTILTKWSECDHCMSEFADAEQVNFNAKQVRDIDDLNKRMENEL